MVALWLLYVACSSVGLPGEVCLSVSYVESRCGANTAHRLPTVRGIMGVDVRWSPLPALALDTTVGGAIGGAIALRYWRERKGSAYLRAYACGNSNLAAACHAYERKVRAVLARLRPHGEV